MGQEIVTWPDFVEIILDGEITRENFGAGVPLSDEQRHLIREHQRILFNLAAVTHFEADVAELGRAMARLDTRGFRLAVYSPGSAFYGIGRQIAAYSGVEGHGIMVFREREEALIWLRE